MHIQSGEAFLNSNVCMVGEVHSIFVSICELVEVKTNAFSICITF
jgi:hypothetical protein